MKGLEGSEKDGSPPRVLRRLGIGRKISRLSEIPRLLSLGSWWDGVRSGIGREVVKMLKMPERFWDLEDLPELVQDIPIRTPFEKLVLVSVEAFEDLVVKSRVVGDRRMGTEIREWKFLGMRFFSERRMDGWRSDDFSSEFRVHNFRVRFHRDPDHFEYWIYSRNGDLVSKFGNWRVYPLEFNVFMERVRMDLGIFVAAEVMDQ